ncbi:hypothetical protein GN244_ATG18849 [Phytophthora infestans]|uniref:Uncharacterized protein n=1 Tax=Phytophthora infestans TaxID=4787 RepID=A0A833WDD1_PHYIN|nr:hypothetical protein GN244_ATG18844 [Phytophthora infestans]KAF4029407.1 hypothetical protein GN244_ATG18846 [Phytophthora infestans]KAF4029410.1 hypothetical protein GN244_ATG18849 [Phytophthora infestans]KAF4138109.1 hypothetical protein GN958_ATG12718 [Phytophthora infestans]KAF4138112.1 hypothetical protein GN958_ATG12721 [Phytophthora infestans]
MSLTADRLRFFQLEPFFLVARFRLELLRPSELLELESDALQSDEVSECTKLAELLLAAALPDDGDDGGEPDGSDAASLALFPSSLLPSLRPFGSAWTAFLDDPWTRREALFGLITRRLLIRKQI